jgi:hypothetical protein
VPAKKPDPLWLIIHDRHHFSWLQVFKFTGFIVAKRILLIRWTTLAPHRTGTKMTIGSALGTRRLSPGRVLPIVTLVFRLRLADKVVLLFFRSSSRARLLTLHTSRIDGKVNIAALT